MTLDEYMADDDDYRAVVIDAHEAVVLLEESINRLTMMTAKRDLWRDLARKAMDRESALLEKCERLKAFG